MTLPDERIPLAKGAWPRRRIGRWAALGGLLIAVLTFVEVTITGPRIHVRWNEGAAADNRSALERRYGLRNGSPVTGTPSTWRYDLGETAPENIRALLEDPAVNDTAYIDRERLTTEGRDIRVTIWYPFKDLFPQPLQLVRLHRSVWLLLAGAVLLWVARAPSVARRRNTTIAALLLVGVVALAAPFEPSFVKMGGSADHVSSRADFERWFGGRVRFEKHLSQVILLQVYSRLEPTEAAPASAVMTLSRLAVAWFVLSALTIAVVERWSVLVVRYLGLVLLAPSALLYFGWREFGYLSLSVPAFPLLARGLKDGSMRLEVGSVFAGLGGALHGSGLVSLAGAWMAALGASGRLLDRIGRALRAVAWGTAAYVGWIAIYVIVLKLPVSPDPGAAAIDPWRSWTVNEMREGRLAAAIFSTTGARDLFMTAWVVGAPLLAVALSLWRRYPHEVRTMLWYIPPSILFVIFRWPFDGVGGGMDLVVAGFPALYALAWVCAHDSRRTNIAALLLVSAHYAFWWVVLDERFEP
jgi:hypothetical protein